MKRIVLIFLFLILLILPAFSQTDIVYDNNKNIRKAHQLIFALRTQSAENLLAEEERANPKNAYITFYRLYSETVDLLISNSPDKYKKAVPRLEGYIGKIEKLTDNAPDFKLIYGEAKVYTGMLKVKYGSKISGMFDCLKGYKLLESNKKEYPVFKPNGKMLGMFHIGVGFMPKILQWGIKILGIKGDPAAGLKELSDYAKYAEGKPGLEEEAFLMTLGAYKIMGQDELVMNLIKNKMNWFKDIALLNYLAATICLESNEAETAIAMLSNIMPEKLELAFPSIYYLTGRAKLFRLDPDAQIPMKRFLKESDGPDFKKATYYNLACSALTLGNIGEYTNYIKQIKVNGRELSNRDIEAEYESNSTVIPNMNLMRASLLIRGGYAQKAMTELIKVQNLTGLTLDEQVRFYYLSGEYHRLIKNPLEAEKYYLKAINIGNERGLNEAQAAIIQAGLMKESIGKKQEAEKYYRQCLQFKDDKSPYNELYKNKAKAGLIRLSQ